MVRVISDLPDGIEIDPAISFGKARIKGARIWVASVLALMADGMSEQDVLTEYPS